MNAFERLKQITPKEFALLGMNDVAYVRRRVANDEVSYEIHGADGTVLAVVPNYDVAVATIRQNDLEPLTLH